MASYNYERIELINKVARDIQHNFKCEYGTLVRTMQDIGFFINWNKWDLNNRPVDIIEIIETLERVIK